MPEFTASHNQIEYTVSEIAGAVKRVVEDTFGYIRVRGEITEWKVAASGHVYFTLKDEKAVLSAVCWRGSVQRLGFKPEDGLEVICTGKISTYPGNSRYQMIVDKMEPAGLGALMALLEKRKQQLAAEGLFNPERKKPIPYLPRIIGVVTSPTGAVIRDILHRIKERFPVHVIVWPVLVQGDGAALQIAAAINGFNTLSINLRPELIIVARGGGSLEDLWAFNEEIVVRAAAASHIPLISAVGHETDTTLIDYVSDLRAPTPTAAAEMAVPVRSDLMLAMSEMELRMRTSVLRRLEQREENIRGLGRGLPRPAHLLEVATQRLDEYAERLKKSLPALIFQKTELLLRLGTSLRPHLLLKDLEKEQQSLSQLLQRGSRAIMQKVQLREQRIQSLSALLESLNYQKVLARGFAMVMDGHGKPVTKVASITPAQKLTLVLQDGEVNVTAAGSLQKSSSKKLPQDSLF